MRDELAFNSKIDLWVLIILLTAVSIAIWALAESWGTLYSRGLLFAVPVAAVIALGIALPLWMLVSLRYFLSNEALRVRCGPFHWQVAVRDITDVSPSRDVASGPAMSLDRLRIEHKGGRALLISPEPRKEFLRQLEYRRKLAAT